jgi:hypothetical protein
VDTLAVILCKLLPGVLLYTDKKEKKIYLMFKEIQSEAVA